MFICHCVVWLNWLAQILRLCVKCQVFHFEIDVQLSEPFRSELNRQIVLHRVKTRLSFDIGFRSAVSVFVSTIRTIRSPPSTLSLSDVITAAHRRH